MTKPLKLNLKLRLSSVLPFQFCRSKHLSTLAETPRPAASVYHHSPVNPKVADIAFPRIPSPPPSTPVSVVSVGCGCRARLPPDREANKAKVRILEETEMLISPSRSFSDDSSLEFPSLESKRRRIKKMRKIRREGWKERMPMTVGAVERKVMGSVAVVKTSEDPYEDFRRSMLEMIMEKEMFEAEELEELLQCFLSLNSRKYHGVIVEAFTEIWEELFCASPDPGSLR